MLFDDDPGIMSEVETSSTGFRRGNKQRSSLPVVRTPSKTLERPLGKWAHLNVHNLRNYCTIIISLSITYPGRLNPEFAHKIFAFQILKIYINITIPNNYNYNWIEFLVTYPPNLLCFQNIEGRNSILIKVLHIFKS